MRESKCSICGDTLACAGFGLGKHETTRLTILQELTDPNNDYENGQWDLICETCESEAARRFLITEGYKIDAKRKAEIRKASIEQSKYSGSIGDVRAQKAKEQA